MGEENLMRLPVLGIILLALLFSKVESQQITYGLTDTILPDSVLIKWVPDSIEAYDSLPTVYAEWWYEISKCAQKQGSLDRVHWWKVIEIKYVSIVDREGLFNCPIVRYCLGWSNNRLGSHNIFIPHSRIYEEPLIKHEMLHDLLGNANLRSPRHHPLFKKCKVL